jgi:hypothetical protein
MEERALGGGGIEQDAFASIYYQFDSFTPLNINFVLINGDF